MMTDPENNEQTELTLLERLVQSAMWSAYGAAGYPFGKTTKGLALWLHFGAQATAN